MSHSNIRHAVMQVRRDEMGMTQVSDDPDCTEWEDRPLDMTFGFSSPDSYLVISLGLCLTEFARRFLSRRQYPQSCSAVLEWTVDCGPRCSIVRIGVRLVLPVILSASECNTLRLMLEQCPIHKAIQGNIQTEVDITHG